MDKTAPRRRPASRPGPARPQPDRLIAAGRLGEAAQAVLRRARDGAPAWEVALWLTRLREKQGRAEEAEGVLRAALRRDPGSAPLSLELARFLGQSGRGAEQAACLREAAGRSPKSAPLQLALARALDADGRPQEALESYRAAVRAAPRDPEAWEACGSACLLAERLDEARRALARAVRLAPGRARPRVELARLLAGRGRLGQALGHLRRARLVKTWSPYDLISLGRLYAQLGKAAAAEAAFARVADLAAREAPALEPLLAGCLRRARAQAPAAEAERFVLLEFLKACGSFRECAEPGAEPCPAAPDLDYLLGRLFLGLRRYGPMRACFARYAARPPGPELFSRLTALLCLQDFDGAFAAAETLLDQRPEDLDAARFEYPLPPGLFRPHGRAFYAAQLEALRRWSRGRPASPWAAFYERALCGLGRPNAPRAADFSAWPARRYGWMRYYTGLDHLTNRRYEQARADFAAAAASRPGLWQARCHLAEALLCLGRRREALAGMEELCQRPAGGFVSGNVLAWHGELLLWCGRAQAALRWLDLARAAGAHYADCWRGGALLLLGRFAEAQAALDREIDNNPNDAEALIWRGELLRRQGRLARARADLDRAVLRGGGDWAYANRALLRAAEGDEAGLLRDFSRVDPEVLGIAAGRLGLPRERWSQPEAARRILEAALSSAAGVRRPQAYARAVFLAARQRRQDPA